MVVVNGPASLGWSRRAAPARDARPPRRVAWHRRSRPTLLLPHLPPPPSRVSSHARQARGRASPANLWARARPPSAVAGAHVSVWAAAPVPRTRRWPPPPRSAAIAGAALAARLGRARCRRRLGGMHGSK